MKEKICYSLDAIEPEKIMQARIADSVGLDKYEWIMQHVKHVDVSRDVDFQHIFNGFYRVRRNENWRKTYYNLFEKSKSGCVSFEDIIRELYKSTGNIEASFSSKMLATLNGAMPIWDKYVIQNLQIDIPNMTDKEKQIQLIVDTYSEIVDWYHKEMLTEKAQECITFFDRLLPDYSDISDIKKLDFYLWSIR